MTIIKNVKYNNEVKDYITFSQYLLLCCVVLHHCLAGATLMVIMQCYSHCNII